MTTTQLYNAVISLLNSLFSTDYVTYTNSSGHQINPIFKGYDNNIVPPKNGNYVILDALEDTNMSLGWSPYYNATTKQNTYGMLVSTKVTIDMYGTNAEDNARVISALSQDGYANLYWLMNNFNCSIHEVKKPINLSDIFGRDMYNKRFMVEIKLFNNVVSKLNTPYFTDVDLKLNWVNNSK